MLIIALTLGLFACAASGGDCRNPTTQRDMNMCASQEYEAADQRLNQAYRQTMATLDDTSRERLRNAQRAWIGFRDRQCNAETAQNRGGSMFPMLYSGCMTRLTNARTRELQSFRR
ncbi:MAG: lysozyme inhibitor LprI family protein [Alphaproteobacteria bacterium]|nr:lysozyme inhibitor LprI family protein [Alphaproteobacteria bacterium]MDE1986649.1 lysozyme inhibitor LprI family protein [Alphaproteobacteria bacterium]MDE2164414.1 lysozyme inhibitor LprI family protein [Alphaproteobacteria bacterium]MDE2499076.1 lysozyme inhibitor LprI family protein [Alphaproteobacteria bacterium]